MRKFYTQTELKERRRELRKYATPAERRLWDHLKGKKLHGYKFRRQHSIGYYIVDFYCSQAKLAVEIDGSHHLMGEQLEYDQTRDQDLSFDDVFVLRFSNDEVLKDLGGVLKSIKEHLHSPTLPGRGMPVRAGGGQSANMTQG